MPVRSSRLVASLVLLGMLVAGCRTPAPDARAMGEPGTRRTLTVLLADDWASADAVVDAITDFEATHDVRVVTRPAAFGQLEEFMIADRSGSQEIDVSQWHAFAAGKLGMAQPVTERFASEYRDGVFIPGAMEDVTWDGVVYGVPLDVNAMVAMVNTDMLERFGHTVEDLRTWDGVRRVAASAAAEGVRLTHLPASTWSMMAWLRANGGRWFERDPEEGTTLLLDSPAVHETFDFLAGLSQDHAMAIPDDETDTDADAYPLFVGGQTMMLTSGTWDVARLLEDEVDFAWEVVPMPLGPSNDGPGTVLGGSSLYITEHADDPALAWEFVTHLIEPRYAMRYARESGRLPARTDVLADPFFGDRRYEVAVDQLPHATPMQLIVYPRVLDVTTNAIFDVLNHLQPVPAAFAAAQEAGTAILQDDADSP